MINRFIDHLYKRTGENFLQPLKSIMRRSSITISRSPTHKFAILFCIGFVSVGILSLAFSSSAETASQVNDNALSLALVSSS
jgi:hypothetical protein